MDLEALDGSELPRSRFGHLKSEEGAASGGSQDIAALAGI